MAVKLARWVGFTCLASWDGVGHWAKGSRDVWRPVLFTHCCASRPPMCTLTVTLLVGAHTRPTCTHCCALPHPSTNTPTHTQALCVCTLGSESDAQRIDSIRGDITSSSSPESSVDDDSSGAGAGAGAAAPAAAPPAAAASSSTPPGSSFERFYLQYFFPPSSVGECGRVGPAGGSLLVGSGGCDDDL